MQTDPIVFIVEDDPAVRDTLAELIRDVPLGVECFGSAEEFLENYDPSQPGCLVLDVRMPGMTGIELQEKLIHDGIRVPVIIISGHGDVPMTVRAMKHGAINFLEKPYSPAELLESVEQAIVIDRQWREEAMRDNELSSKLSRLSESEREVMERIVSGHTNEAIATALDVSLRTVQYRRAAIMKKMNVSSRADLVELVLPTVRNS